MLVKSLAGRFTCSFRCFLLGASFCFGPNGKSTSTSPVVRWARPSPHHPLTTSPTHPITPHPLTTSPTHPLTPPPSSFKPHATEHAVHLPGGRFRFALGAPFG